MLLTIAGVLIIIWLVGLLVHVGGAFINIILIVALIIAVYNFMVRGRTKV
jgi:Family of unknown function (DUF5670)